MASKSNKINSYKQTCASLDFLTRKTLHLAEKKNTRYIVISLLVLVLFFIPLNNAYSIGVTLGTKINLSNDGGISFQPQIAVSGSNIHVVWRDTTSGNQILYSKSTDGGTTFNGGSPGSPVTLSSTLGINQNPQIAVSGNNVYVMWNNATSGNSDVFFTKSTDNGATFGSTINLSHNNGLSTTQRIAVSGNNVYVVWQDSTPGTAQIFLSASTDGGTIFNGGTSSSPGTPINISNDLGVTPQIAISSSSVNVVWTNSTSGNGDIFYSKASVGTTSFSLPVDISSMTGSSTTPQIAVSGSNVYAVWSDNHLGNTDIFFTKSTDNGATFAGPVNLSNSTGSSQDPQIAVSGSDIHVVWSDSTFGGGDILYCKSADSGSTFNSPNNLSGNTGLSSKPQIGVSGTNVNAVWSDTTAGNSGILLTASDDAGATFGGVSNLSNNNISVTPQISASGNNEYVIWEDVTGNDDVFFRSASNTAAINISFNASQYKLSQTATITVVDPSSNINSGIVDTISANVKSSSDGIGLPITLTETGQNTGVFTASLSFSTTASSGTTLKAAPGDTITATFGSVVGTASIFSRTIDFSGITTFDGGAIGNVRVTDQNSNLNASAIETIQVNVKTNTNPTGIPLLLTETGPNTGIFGGTSSQLLFSYDTDGLFPTDRTLTISEKDISANASSSVIDTTTVLVSSTSDPGFSMIVNETGINTGVFTGKLHLSSTAANHATNTLLARGSDILTITHATKISHGLVIPNSNSSNGIIQISDSGSDTVTASYQGVISSATVFDAYAPGGGGGGLVRPGLVLDIVASLSNSGSSSPPSPKFNLGAFAAAGLLPSDVEKKLLDHNPLEPIGPSNDPGIPYYPLSIDGNNYLLGGYSNTLQTVTEHVGKPMIMKITTISRPIMHIGMYANLHSIYDEVTNSDTYISYDKGQQLQVVDPHGFFSTVKLDAVQNGTKQTFVYNFTFAKPMDTSNIILRAWDDHHSSNDLKIFDAWQVIESNTTKIFKSETDVPSPDKLISQPVLKPLQSTELLESIKEWGGYSSQSIPDSQLLGKIGIQGEHIPPWYMKTTRWVVDGTMTENDFVNGIKYLNDKGLIR